MLEFTKLASILEKTNQGETLTEEERERIITKMLHLANKKVAEIVADRKKYHENS